MTTRRRTLYSVRRRFFNGELRAAMKIKPEPAKMTQTHGIVRPAKRPEGFVPQGPQPAGPQDDPELWPKPDEDLCFLSGDWRIFQKLKGHRWSLDDMMTAWWAITHAPPEVKRTLDLGCGIGSVLLMVAWAFEHAQATGVEAQSLSFELAQRSIRYNGAHQRVTIHHGDLRDDSILASAQKFDLITGTPPYIPIGAGALSERPQRGPCRIETRGGVEAYCQAAARVLASQGRFFICEGANPHERTFEAASMAGLKIVRWRPVITRVGKAPLFVLYAMTHGQAPPPPADEPFFVRDAQAQRTAEYIAARRRLGMPP